MNTQSRRFEASAHALDRHKAQLSNDTIVLHEAINFASSSSTILEESYGILNEVSNLLQKHHEIGTVHIEGHTDAEGGSFFNQKLSEQRADAVARYLSEKGVKQVLRTQGYGEQNLVCKVNSIACHAKNRRVEFRVQK